MGEISTSVVACKTFNLLKLLPTTKFGRRKSGSTRTQNRIELLEMREIYSQCRLRISLGWKFGWRLISTCPTYHVKRIAWDTNQIINPSNFGTACA